MRPWAWATMGVILAALAVGTSLAWATPEDDFVAATRLPADEAARSLAQMAVALPADSPVRVDVLFELARLRDEELEDPAGARRTYDQLIREAPGSRLARRAEKRAGELARTLGPGDRYAPTIVAVARAARRPPADQLVGAEELAAALTATPDYPGRAEVARWIAGAYRRADRYPEARTWFERARDAADQLGATDDGREARRGLAELATAVGDFAAARAGYRTLLTGASPGDRVGIESALARIDTLEGRRARAQGAWIVLGVLAIVAGLALRRAGVRALWPPPTELLYLAPVAVLIGAMALTGNVLVARAVISVLGAGLVVTWLSGALLTGVPLTRRRVAVHATLAILAVASVALLALSRDALLDLLAATFRDGVER